MTANLVPGGPFDIPEHDKGEFILGKLYTRTWAAPFTHGLTDAWRERCQGYWARVEERFGYVFSEPKYVWTDDPIEGPCVVTMATPIAKLKGTRVKRPRTLDEITKLAVEEREKGLVH